MAGLVQAFKKGNQTLTRKVEVLEQQIEELEKENLELKIENHNLINRLANLQSKKGSDGLNTIKYFVSMYNKMLNS